MKTNLLKAAIAEKEYTQREVAEKIGMVPQTFYRKMKNGDWGCKDAEALIRVLDIADPVNIFLTSN